jgi:hypothetical protein
MALRLASDGNDQRVHRCPSLRSTGADAPRARRVARGYVVIVGTFPPGQPALHVHPHTDEAFYVAGGDARVRSRRCRMSRPESLPAPPPTARIRLLLSAGGVCVPEGSRCRDGPKGVVRGQAIGRRVTLGFVDKQHCRYGQCFVGRREASRPFGPDGQRHRAASRRPYAAAGFAEAELAFRFGAQRSPSRSRVQPRARGWRSSSRPPAAIVSSSDAVRARRNWSAAALVADVELEPVARRRMDQAARLLHGGPLGDDLRQLGDHGPTRRRRPRRSP